MVIHPTEHHLVPERKTLTPDPAKTWVSLEDCMEGDWLLTKDRHCHVPSCKACTAVRFVDTERQWWGAGPELGQGEVNGKMMSQGYSFSFAR